MLGIVSERKPINGKFAKEIRELVRKIATNDFSKEELEALRKNREYEKKHTIVWE